MNVAPWLRTGLIGWLRASAIGLAVAVLLVGSLAWSTVEKARGALERSDRAFDAGQLGKALREARVAAAARVPGADHWERADARLRAIAFGAEALGDDQLARQAWGALRGAAIERRHPFAPEPALNEADRHLARLLSRAHDPRKARVFSEEELLSELVASRPSVVFPVWSTGAATPLFGALALVWWRRRRPAAREGRA